MENTDFDIAICGAGPVGQALALMLLRQGANPQRIALLDAKTAEQASQDARTIALSYGSKQLLAEIEAWPVRATAIATIHVSRRGHFGRTLIDCADYRLPALGYVAHYGDIVQPLQQRIAATPLSFLRPLAVEQIQESDQQVQLQLSDGRSLSSQILVQAEGGTFDDQAQRRLRHDYQQTGIIAHVKCSAPIAGRAFERFTAQGPLALLPQGDGYALVWCVRPATAHSLMALDDAAFRTELQSAFGQRLGHFQHLSRRHAFPLGLNAQEQVTARTVSIGNAAQTLHPVAGQGLNLGLRDAAVLASVLAQAQTPAALQDFVQRRAADRRSTIRLTDSLARIFASAPDGSPSQALLGLGLGLLDLLKPARAVLARHMLFGWR
ncbi:MAG: UbiH/UbiF/VisC/COQ6 family ubiquinone biosynthesis hydroxylase [Burkholderiales bacterium]|nr:UbiH/UbiF/VisC/COQ6 family ubiquinone biosynthesis hydroxylase [Burkholderiales bacterium]